MSKLDGWPCAQTPYAAAGFMFFSGAALKNVPFDPLLPYLFDGEEILYSARLWTHGCVPLPLRLLCCIC